MGWLQSHPYETILMTAMLLVQINKCKSRLSTKTSISDASIPFVPCVNMLLKMAAFILHESQSNVQGMDNCIKNKNIRPAILLYQPHSVLKFPFILMLSYIL